MREIHRQQPYIGEIKIEDIRIDLKSRDEVPAILLGLQSVWADQPVRAKILELLASIRDRYILSI